jgi:hypothetical protein
MLLQLLSNTLMGFFDVFTFLSNWPRTRLCTANLMPKT